MKSNSFHQLAPHTNAPAAWNNAYTHILKSEGVEFHGVLPLSLCRITAPHLLERSLGDDAVSVILFLVPYYTCAGENLSAYAVSKDYHLYMNELFQRIIPLFSEAYPTEAFAGFADHSPIDERHAALLCGLGVKGQNGLLINADYGSYVFIGEILTTALPEALGFSGASAVQDCLGCHQCLHACPVNHLAQPENICLSALTQKKGDLSPHEQALIKKSGCVWGCDVCQSVCPMNRHAKPTPIPFFHEAGLTQLDKPTLMNMSQTEFRARAYAWRGQKTVLRNIEIVSEKGVI